MSDIQKQGYHIPRGQIRLVPGDIVYDKLIKTNPQKLKRLQKEEKDYFLKTHAPGWEEKVTNGINEVRAMKERWAKKSSDAQLLELTGIDGPLTKRIIRNAYRRLARKLHPDAGGTDEAFKQLHEAYRRLLAGARE